MKNDGVALPLDTCFTLRNGDDVTLVTWGRGRERKLAAADQLSAEGSVLSHLMWRPSNRWIWKPFWHRLKNRTLCDRTRSFADLRLWVQKCRAQIAEKSPVFV